MSATASLDRAVSLLVGSTGDTPRVSVLTGAGISTGSGIPDFRGPQGLWTTDPGAAALFDIDTYLSDADARRQVWRMRAANPALTAEPTAAHRSLTELERGGRVRALITQNIDGLHQRAESDHVIEVHGTLHRVVCLSCGTRTPTPEVLERLEEESDPRCLSCGGIQKVDTVSFGQRLDTSVLEAAITATKDCDVFLTIGTSLSVNPVAGLCDLALDAGAALVVVNGEPTPYDEVADTVLRDPIDTVVPELVDRVLGTSHTPH